MDIMSGFQGRQPANLHYCDVWGCDFVFLLRLAGLFLKF
ncbi:hypothetical protein Z948_201 [Sulfitobacter donghicola DSW-25 = KCTC 12864 = JCM 14565]|nr:hypothetical protein Z948_201 [Sulfitobacter donghicola DSW-25 = KCTC 12864 = JCM 14565]